MRRRASRTFLRWSVLLLAGVSSVGACAPASPEEPAPETLTAEGQPLPPIVAPAAPEAPRFSECPDGWTAEGEGASLRCRPDWSVEPPRLTDCPEGWAIRAVGNKESREVCLPAAPATCPGGERRDLKSAACMRVGTECPTDSEWATPPSGATELLYVLPGGTGDGSEAAPFGTIEAAIAAASPGAVVLLAAGEYTTQTIIADELTLLGACASETRILGTAAPVNDAEVNEDFEGALHVDGTGRLTLENVTLSGDRTALTVRGGGSASLSDILVEDVTPQGLWVADPESSLSVSKTLFVGGRVAEGRTVAPGVVAAFDGHAEIRDSAFVHNKGRAVAALNAGSVVLGDVSVTEVERGSGQNTTPLYAADAGRIDAQRLHVSGFFGYAVGASGGTTNLTQVAIEHGVSSGSSAQTIGLILQNGGKASCSACVIRDVQGFGVATPPSDERGSLELTDVLIAELHPSADGTGAGISTVNSDVALERVEILDVPGIAVSMENCAASLTDVRAVDAGIIHDDSAGVSCREGAYTLQRVAAEGLSLGVLDSSYVVEEVTATGWTEVLQDGEPFWGVVLSGEGEARRVHVADSYGPGIDFGPGSHQAVGIVVQDLKPVVTGDFDMALGIGLADKAQVEGKEWVTRRVSGVGIVGGGTLSLEDAVVADTLERRDGAFGIGVQLSHEANIARLRVERTFGAGMFASGATVTLEDVGIFDTRSGRVGGLFGQGLAAMSTKLDAARVSIDGAQVAGLSTEACDMTLRDLAVTQVQPGSAFHDGGEGLWFTGVSDVVLERALVADVFSAGLGATAGANVQATELEIRNVAPGRALLKDVFGVQEAEGVADCVVLAEGARGTFARSSLRDCARSGVLLQRATASLADVEIRHAPVGVATQYAELPQHEPSLLYFEQVDSASVRDPGYGIPSGPPIGGVGEDTKFDDLFLESER